MVKKKRRHAARLPDPVLCKLIFQARYKPELGFYDLLLPAAKRVSDDDPPWQTSRLNITLRDCKKRCSLQIHHHNFSYEQDHSSVANETKKISRALWHQPSRIADVCVRTARRTIAARLLRVHPGEGRRVTGMLIGPRRDGLCDHALPHRGPAGPHSRPPATMSKPQDTKA